MILLQDFPKSQTSLNWLLKDPCSFRQVVFSAMQPAQVTSLQTDGNSTRGQPVFVWWRQFPLWLCGGGVTDPRRWRVFMWGAPWVGWRTATTEGGVLPPHGLEGGLRSWGRQLESRPSAGPPGSRQEGTTVNNKGCYWLLFLLSIHWLLCPDSPPLCPSSAFSVSSTAPSWRSSQGTRPSLRGASAPAPILGPGGFSSRHIGTVSIMFLTLNIIYNCSLLAKMGHLIKGMNILRIQKNKYNLDIKQC